MSALPVSSAFLKSHHLEDGGEDIKVRAVFVMEGRRTRLALTTEQMDAVTVVLLVAALTETPRGLVVKFVPGPTSFESFYWAGAAARIGAMDDCTPERSMFGGFNFAEWILCAGTPGRWDRLTVLVRDMKEMAAYFTAACAEEAK